jgi:hypothetical protein
MKPALFAAALAAIAVSAAPALGQDAPPAPPPVPAAGDYAPQGGNVLRDDPYRLDPFFRTGAQQCFDGRAVVGANRAGETTLYVQARRSPIYRLELAETCGALDSALKLGVRAEGARVCANGSAVLLVKTPAGEKRCRVRDVKRLSRTEVAEIAAAR